MILRWLFILLDILRIKTDLLHSKIWRYYIQLKFPLLKIEGKINIKGIPMFEINGEATIKSGNTFVSSPKYNPVGLTKKCNIYVRQGGKLLLESGSGYSGVSIVCWNMVTIGKECGFGGNVSIWDTDFHGIAAEDRVNMDAVKTEPVIIGNNVWVGANCMLLKGTVIGDKSIIGAGSVVNKKIPPDEIWAGNPARFIRKVG